MPDAGAPDAAPKPICVYAMPGSQYSAKVIAALDSRKVPHAVVFVSPVPSRRKLPSGGRMVPEMTYGDEVVKDSEAILHFCDEHLDTQFFPTTAASDLSKRADGILAGAVLYYNWVYPDGYRRTMRKAFDRVLPPWVCLFRGLVIDSFLSKARRSMAAKAAEQLGITEAELRSCDEPQVRAMLVRELEEIQASLQSEEQPYLLGQTSTAADFAVYAQVERLVGDMGDVAIPSSLPQLAEESALARLWKWHQLMRERHPIVFKGKRPAKAEASKL